jgi:hypothetical protein
MKSVRRRRATVAMPSKSFKDTIEYLDNAMLDIQIVNIVNPVRPTGNCAWRPD